MKSDPAAVVWVLPNRCAAHRQTWARACAPRVPGPRSHSGRRTGEKLLPPRVALAPEATLRRVLKLEQGTPDTTRSSPRDDAWLHHPKAPRASSVVPHVAAPVAVVLVATWQPRQSSVKLPCYVAWEVKPSMLRFDCPFPFGKEKTEVLILQVTDSHPSILCLLREAVVRFLVKAAWRPDGQAQTWVWMKCHT